MAKFERSQKYVKDRNGRMQVRKADKRKRRLEGMSETTKIRWACEGKTTYEKKPNGLTDYSKPMGFDVERWGFYFKHDQTNEATWLSDDDLDYLGRREVKPTSQEDIKTAFAYVLFKCATHSDGQAYTGERLNISWFTRFAVESGFTASEAVDCTRSLWFSEVKQLCGLMAQSVGVTNLPPLHLSPTIPSSHKMEHAKNVPYAQLILNRMSKHAETRFKDIDADSSEEASPSPLPPGSTFKMMSEMTGEEFEKLKKSMGPDLSQGY